MTTLTQTVVIVSCIFTLNLVFETHALETTQTVVQIEREVRNSLRNERDLSQIQVSVYGTEVTLTGRVPTFWAKNQAIKRALEVEGVETVVSEIEIPSEEKDSDIAEDVGKSLRRYPHYTIWDHIEGRVDKGVVWLSGWVTPVRDKSGEIFERVAKINGVQDVQNDVRTLPPSTADASIRNALAARIFSNIHFQQFSTRVNPPFHIIVHNSVVTLVGRVQSNLELIELQRIVRQTPGILRVENELETIK